MKKETLIPASRIPIEVRLYSNISFLMADVTNTLLMDTLSRVRRAGFDVKQSTKMRFNHMMRALEAARRATHNFTREMYELEADTAEKMADDSDFFADIVLLIADRTGDDPERQRQVKTMLLNMKSKLRLYDKITSEWHN